MEKQAKKTRDFKPTTVVNIKVTLLQLVTTFSLIQGYQSFRGIFSLHFQDTQKNVAVFSHNHPLPVCPTHNVSTAATNQPTTNNHTQPCLKYVTFSITRYCRRRMLHVRSPHATGSYHIYCIHAAALPIFIKIFHGQNKKYISMSCHVTGVYHTALNIMCQVPLSLSQRQY
jgi:hypothetical protein